MLRPDIRTSTSLDGVIPSTSSGTVTLNLLCNAKVAYYISASPHLKHSLPNPGGDQQRCSGKEVEAFPTTARLILAITIREGTQPLRGQRLPKRTVAACRVIITCEVEQAGMKIVDDLDGFLGEELAVSAHDDALSTLRSDARCLFRFGRTYRSRVYQLPAKVRRSQHVDMPPPRIVIRTGRGQGRYRARCGDTPQAGCSPWLVTRHGGPRSRSGAGTRTSRWWGRARLA